MILTKLVLKLIKVLNSETSANSLAWAFALGLFLGFVPLASLQTALVVLAVLVLRINLTAWLAMLLVGKLLGLLLVPLFDVLGRRLLEVEGLRELWSFATNHALLGYLRLGNSIALGGTLVGLAVLVPVWLLGRLGVRAYRARLEGRLSQSRWARSFQGLKIVTLYRRLTSPFA